MVTQQTDAGTRALLERIQADVYGHGAAAAQAQAAADPFDGAMAGATLAARIEAHLGSLSRTYTAVQRKAALELARRMRGVAAVPCPPVPFKPVAGVLQVDPAGRTSSAEFAPQDGYIWFMTHIVAAGLAGAGGTGATAAQTLSAYGSVTNPGAGGTIASLTLPAGTWDLQVDAGFQGTLTAADTDNMQLTVPSGGPFTLFANSTTQGSAQNPATQFRVVIPTGGGTVAVKAIAAASGASAVYRAAIFAQADYSLGGDTVQLYKYSQTGGGLSAGVGLNNYLHTFTPANPDWSLSSSSFFLLPDDNLTLVGSGIVSPQILLTGSAVQVELPLTADYLM